MKKRLIIPVVVTILSLFLNVQTFAEVCVDETEMDVLDYTLDSQSLIVTESVAQPLPTGKLVIGKQLIAGNWRVACDVMGSQTWVPDTISNPSGNKGAEGHQLSKCGDPLHWIVWLDTSGKPFLLQELLSGATGGTLDATIYTDSTYTTLRDISTVQLNERIYWTTQVGNRIWHHTGITIPETPKFIFNINGIEYTIQPGQQLILQNLPSGIYTITEKYNPDYFIANVSTQFQQNEQGDVIVTVEVQQNGITQVNFVNQKIIPDPPEPPEPQTDPIIIETETVSESETGTEIVIIEQVTQKPTQILTQKPVQTQTQIQLQTQTQTQLQTQTQTELILIQSQSQSELIQSQSQSQTELIQSQSELIQSQSQQTKIQTQNQTELIQTQVQKETESSPIAQTETQHKKPQTLPQTETQQEKQESETEKATEKEVKFFIGTIKNLPINTSPKQIKIFYPAQRQTEYYAAAPAQSNMEVATGDDSPVAATIFILLISAIVIVILVLCLKWLKK